MLRRPAILLAVVLAASTQMPSHAAAAKPQVSDAKGDSVGGQGGTDIVSVLYSTTGTGKGRSYVAKKLLVTMTLAGDAVTTPGFTYEASANTSTCGVVTFSSQNGSPYHTVTSLNGWADWGDCTKPGANGDSAVELLTVAVKGNTLTWSMPIKSLPKGLKLGSVFSDFEARVDPTNPVVPFPSNVTGTELGLIDVGTGTAPWKLG